MHFHGDAGDAGLGGALQLMVAQRKEKQQGGKQKLPDWYYDLSEENARQQGGAGAAQAARAITRRGRNAFLQNLFAQIEAEIIDNS